MRSWLAGWPAVSTARPTVRHVRTSRLARARTKAQMAHVAGNKMKLEGVLAHADIGKLAAENHAVLWRDLMEKAAALEALRE
jgi:hypothetical protein